MNRFWIVFAFLFAACTVSPWIRGASAQLPASARSVALGGATTSLAAESGRAANPASWSAADRFVLGLDAAQLYGMTELRSAAAHVLWPLRRTAFALSAETFGFDLYRETLLAVGISRSFRPSTFRSVHAGVRLALNTIRVDGYGSTTLPTLSVGFLIPLLPSVSLGALAENLAVLRSSIRDEVDRSLSLGASVTHGEHVTVTTDVIKELRAPADVRIGLEIRPVLALALRGGLTTDPPRYALGAGIRSGPFSLDAAAERHYALGWSPILSVRIRW